MLVLKDPMVEKHENDFNSREMGYFRNIFREHFMIDINFIQFSDCCLHSPTYYMNFSSERARERTFHSFIYG